MVSTETEIANMALSHIGFRSITALTDPSPEGEACNRFYRISIRELLVMTHWGFAEVRESLSLTSVTPIGYAYQYDYPQTCLKIRRVYNTVAGRAVINDDPIPYRVGHSGGDKVLWTDYENAGVFYTKEITDTGLFPQLFVKALVFLLARNIAFPLTRDIDLSNKMEEMFLTVVRLAAQVDAQEEVVTSEFSNYLLNARR